MEYSKYFKIKNYKDFILNKIKNGGKISYSQSGEDLIIESALKFLSIKKTVLYRHWRE